MTTNHATHHLRRTATTLLLTATLAAPTTMLTAPTATAATCPTVDAVAIPGTTQTSTDADPNQPVGILGDILEPLKKWANKITTYYTPYPASIIGGTDGGGYLASKTAGIDTANAHIKTTATRCPNTAFIITGYSQGADAAGDIAAAIGNNRGVIPANKLLAAGLVADPSQAPIGQPTIGLSGPGFGFAGIRAGGFGSLPDRGGILSVCDPLDYYCHLPQSDLVMRFIGNLGSHLDASDPAASAQKLSTMFMAGLIAPATAAIQQILQLVNDPNLLPHLVQRGALFARALASQLFSLAGPQVAGAASDLLEAAGQVINLIQNQSWTALPALIANIGTKATTLATSLTGLRDRTSTINTSGFAAVGNAMNGMTAPNPVNFGSLSSALLNAITIAGGGIGTQATGAFGPTFSQFTADTVGSAFKHFAEFISGNYHSNYESTPLDPNGHSGSQIIQKYFANQLEKIQPQPPQTPLSIPA